VTEAGLAKASMLTRIEAKMVTSRGQSMTRMITGGSPTFDSTGALT